MPSEAAVRTVDAILFDLDGTLVDTREDIAFSVNYALARLKRAPRSLDEVTGYIGDGATQLLERALGPVDRALVEEAVKTFKAHYLEHCADRARLYPGVAETLNHFKAKKLAVVTNKPAAHSEILLKNLGLRSFFSVVIGGDSHPVRKPEPGPLLEAARRLGVEPARALMVGDSPGDVVAGKAAGMATVAVSYGYRPEPELRKTAPDFILAALPDLQEAVS